MLLLSGVVHKVFVTDRKKTNDGREYGGDSKVQIMTTVALENGTSKDELVDLKVPDRGIFEAKQGRPVHIPVGAFAPAKGSVVFFLSGTPQFPQTPAAPAK